MQRVVFALLCGAVLPLAAAETGIKRDVLLWQLQLPQEQCPNNKGPCHNIYALNQAQGGEPLWYAYTTSSCGIKGISLGHYSLYYTTWSGPGLYSVNVATGHARWQFPTENWFKYWIKDIDLPRTASFESVEESKHFVIVATKGPPSRVYGLHTKTGSKRWEVKPPAADAVLVDTTGPASSLPASTKAVFLAFFSPASSTTWLQAVDVSQGTAIWTMTLDQANVDRIEVHEQQLLLATTASADAILAFNSSNGRLLWQQPVPFCSTASPIEVVYEGRLLLSQCCDNLDRLSAVDVLSGNIVWHHEWQQPHDEAPKGNCSSMSVRDGSIVFGCSCGVKKFVATVQRVNSSDGSVGDSASGSSSSRTITTAASEHDSAVPASNNQHKLQQQQVQRRQLRHRRQWTGQGSAIMHSIALSPQQQYEHEQQTISSHDDSSGICLYSVGLHSGKLQWATPVSGPAKFPSEAQAWGFGPLLHQSVAIFVTSNQVLGIDGYSGRLNWTLPLRAGEEVPAWQLPTYDSTSSTLLVTAQFKTNKTGISAVLIANGTLLWHNTVNGTAQQPDSLRAGGREPLLSQGKLFVEACQRVTCCLRALNLTTGKKAWGVCLEAVAGEDATHPRAQFAIWLITLMTIGSIVLLIFAACLVYVHRWRQERRILHGRASGSPRHSYRPLPDAGFPSDSDEEISSGFQHWQQQRQQRAGPFGTVASTRQYGGAAAEPFDVRSGTYPAVVHGVGHHVLHGNAPFVSRPLSGGAAAAGQSGVGALPASDAGQPAGSFGFRGQLTASSQPQAAAAAAAAATAADREAMQRHLEAVLVQERGAISAHSRPRVPADDNPAQGDSM